MTEFPEDVVESHRDLSHEAVEFLHYAARQPSDQWVDYRHLPDLPDWMAAFTYDLQAWPTFVGPEKVRQIERVTVGVADLIRAIPTRVFDSDARRIAEYFRTDDELAVALLLEPPTGLEGSAARCDYVETEEGPKVVEVNTSSHLGGWQLRYWEEFCRRDPIIIEFLEERRLRVEHRDPLAALLRHAAIETLELGIGSEGRMNLVLAVEPEFYPTASQALESLQQLYRQVLDGIDPALHGSLDMSPYPDGLATRSACLYHRGRKVHTLIEYCAVDTPAEVYRCFKGGNLALFSGPIRNLLSDKRNLALLSELVEDPERSHLLNAEERNMVRDHIPWSREVEAREVAYEGQQVFLPDLLRGDRGGFVLKPGQGKQGEGVTVGRFTDPATWDAWVERAVQERGWLAQRYEACRPYYYLAPDGEPRPHDVVWGTFAFGQHYGGGFLRMMHEGSDGVVNAARGATEGFIFEVLP